jgi:hypothetical protein
MEKKCKKCKSIINGTSIKVIKNNYYGHRRLPDEVCYYCCEKCRWSDFLNKD